MSAPANPYASPTETGPADTGFDGNAGPGSLDAPRRKRLEVGEVVVAWEKRRFWYNAALTGVVLMFSPLIAYAFVNQLPVRLSLGQAAGQLLACVAGANACYCAGPIVEGYWTWFFGPTRWVRNVLFVTGVAFAALLTAAVCCAALFVLEVPPQS